MSNFDKLTKYGDTLWQVTTANSGGYIYISTPPTYSFDFTASVYPNPNDFTLTIIEKGKKPKPKFKKGDEIIDKNGNILLIKHVWRRDYIVENGPKIAWPKFERKCSIEDIDMLYGKLDGLAGAIFAK